MAVLPKGVCEEEIFDIHKFEGEKFLLLEKEENTEISDILKKYQISPNIRVTTWDDYSIMAMVERKMGYAILPELILRCVPYNVDIRPLNVPAWRNIGLVYKGREVASAAMRRFQEYVQQDQKFMIE